MDLTAIFGKYVGIEIKNPDRMTCDMDFVAEEIYDTARQNGLTLQFSKDPHFVDRNSGGNGVTAYIEQTDPKKPWAWTVKRFAPT